MLRPFYITLWWCRYEKKSDKISPLWILEFIGMVMTMLMFSGIWTWDNAKLTTSLVQIQTHKALIKFQSFCIAFFLYPVKSPFFSEIVILINVNVQALHHYHILSSELTKCTIKVFLLYILRSLWTYLFFTLEYFL